MGCMHQYTYLQVLPFLTNGPEYYIGDILICISSSTKQARSPQGLRQSQKDTSILILTPPHPRALCYMTAAVPRSPRGMH